MRTSGELETIKARIRASAKHPFGVIKLQFEPTKVPYIGLTKNIGRLILSYTMSNLWTAQKAILQRTPLPCMG